MPLILGTVAFSDFEIPERMPWGGSQRLVTHRLIGGKRVIEAMGLDDAPIRWEGRFRGLTATLRARQLDFMRRAGRTHLLTWDAFLYRVVIESFEADYEAFYEIPYRMSCVVVSDLIAQTVGPLLQSVEDAITGGLNDMLGVAGDDPLLGGVATGLRTAIGSAVTGGRLDLASLGAAGLAGLQAGAAGAFATVAGQAEAASTAIVTGPVAGVVPGGDPAAMAAGVSGQVATVDQAYRSEGVRALLGNLRGNLGGG